MFSVIGVNIWKGWKRDDYRSILFGIGPEEEEILVDQAEDGIHRGQNRPSA
jgi:hypothetical protein